MLSRLSASRRWQLVGIAASVVILLAGWFLLISPQRSKASDIKQQAAQAEGTTQGLQAKAASLRKQSEDLPAKIEELKTLSERLPDDAGVATIIRQITAEAARSGVTINSFTPGTPTPVVAPVPVAPAPTDSSSTSPSAAPSTNPNPAPGSAANLSFVTVAIVAQGTTDQVTNFIKGLENITRAMLITDVQLAKGTGDGEDGQLTATIQGRIFMRATPGATPSASASPSQSTMVGITP